MTDAPRPVRDRPIDILMLDLVILDLPTGLGGPRHVLHICRLLALTAREDVLTLSDRVGRGRAGLHPEGR